jgi:hypothetical protein
VFGRTSTKAKPSLSRNRLIRSVSQHDDATEGKQKVLTSKGDCRSNTHETQNRCPRCACVTQVALIVIVVSVCLIVVGHGVTVRVRIFVLVIARERVADNVNEPQQHGQRKMWPGLISETCDSQENTQCSKNFICFNSLEEIYIFEKIPTTTN